MARHKHARRRFRGPAVIFAATVALLAGVGVAFATWTATGSGTGFATAQTAVALSTVAVAPAATLYPGQMAGDAVISVTNPNNYPVTVTDVVGSGAITTNPSVPSCDASTGVTFTDQHGLSLVVPALSTGTTFTLSGSVAMSDASDNSCQGATFQIPVSLTGNS